MSRISDRHADLAARFVTLADGVTDWAAPAPVDNWKARDVVGHLATWLPGFLQGFGADFTAVTHDDPVTLWRLHSAAVQELLDDPARAGQIIETPMGSRRVDEAVEQFYLSDIHLHRWDLAKASGQPVGWDDTETLTLVEAMTPTREMLAASGQFGTPVVLDETHSPEDRLAALIGRDPGWTPPAH